MKTFDKFIKESEKVDEATLKQVGDEIAIDIANYCSALPNAQAAAFFALKLSMILKNFSEKYKNAKGDEEVPEKEFTDLRWEIMKGAMNSGAKLLTKDMLNAVVKNVVK